MPAGAGVADDAAADHAGPVHLPDRHRPIGVLPQKIGFAVGVEVGGLRVLAQRRPRSGEFEYRTQTIRPAVECRAEEVPGGVGDQTRSGVPSIHAILV